MEFILMQPKILAFAGSTRIDSFNKKLIHAAARIAKNTTAHITIADLGEYPMPIYNADEEKIHGLPSSVQSFQLLLRSHDAFLIASPEYNGAVPGLLKNALDWASRPIPGEPPLVAFSGKVAAILSASPGALGGLRGLLQLRMILWNLGLLVLPDQVTISRAHEAFSKDGQLMDKAKLEKVQHLITQLTETALLLKIRSK